MSPIPPDSPDSPIPQKIPKIPKSRLGMIENRRKVDDKDPTKPQLRKKPGTGGDDKDSKGDEDERPTMKRR